MKALFNSKRFIAYALSMAVFIVGMLFTDIGVLELAGAISVLSAIYIGAETYKKSETTDKQV